jgi:DNA replication licensing factor MCM7
MVHLRGSLTRSLKAGDSVVLSGIFLPEPYTGQRAMLRATLLTATYMEVMAVKQNKQSYQDMNLSDGQRAAIESMTEEGDIYTRLATSIAPGQQGRQSAGGRLSGGVRAGR